MAYALIGIEEHELCPIANVETGPVTKWPKRMTVTCRFYKMPPTHGSTYQMAVSL